LAGGQSEEERAKLGLRLNNVVLILTEAEKFQARSWIRTEQRAVDGREMFVNTIYFGLSIAFAADELETVALRGSPDAGGWSFEKLPASEAPRILELIDVAALKGEIKFVEVPLQLR
jgi:hypothetical protein